MNSEFPFDLLTCVSTLEVDMEFSIKRQVIGSCALSLSSLVVAIKQYYCDPAPIHNQELS